jgi:NitT/TauT family transport system ATP-binding protein
MEIRVEHLTKIWRDKRGDVVAIDRITHRFPSARFTSILGPSGCGKSTLIQIIGGLEPASGGTVRITNPNNPNAESTQLGAHSVMVWQTLNLFPWRTVLNNVAFGLEVQGIPKQERRERATHWIASVGLRRFAEHYPHQLSGGMRQRVALARALIMERPIMLMDEPFAALDAQTKIVMQEELARIFERTQKSILFVTHAIDEAILLGDEVIVMTARPGRIKEVIVIDLPRPRSQKLVNTTAFGRLYDRALHLIREEVLNAMREQES